MTNSQYFQPGNIIPHEWYKKFSGPDGPDLVCITLLADIVGLYRLGHNIYESKNPNFPTFTGDSLFLSYEYFEEKFGFGKDRVRRALVRLENLNILKREVRNIQSSLNKRINKLFVILDSVFFKSCFRDPERDIRVEIKSKVNDSNTNSSQSEQPCRDPIIGKKNIKEDRSNFLKDSSSSLKDFYPLSEQDCNTLQSLSGRSFSIRAMNEILLDMSQKLKDRWFKAKKYFLNYMAKVFKYELRDAVKTSNETFCIKNNLKIEDASVQEHIAKTAEIKKQEQYLTEIEYSLEVSPEWHLKKKLASVLERSTAYNLLSSYIGSRYEDDTYIMKLSRDVPLSPGERRIILDQVKATHYPVEKVEIVKVDLEKNNILVYAND